MLSKLADPIETCSRVRWVINLIWAATLSPLPALRNAWCLEKAAGVLDRRRQISSPPGLGCRPQLVAQRSWKNCTRVETPSGGQHTQCFYVEDETSELPDWLGEYYVALLVCAVTERRCSVLQTSLVHTLLRLLTSTLIYYYPCLSITFDPQLCLPVPILSHPITIFSFLG